MAWKSASESVETADEPPPDEEPFEIEPEEAGPPGESSVVGPEITESPADPPPLRPYPRPNRNLPELPTEQQKLIDQWWAATDFCYRKRNVDQMIQRLDAALTELPGHFPHLYLHEEYIFELAGTMARQGRMPECVRLLERLRREQRQMYSFCYGAYDTDIISELVIEQKAAEIPAYFDLFKEYPDAQPDYCHEICDLLAWSGHAEQLFALCEAVAVPMLTSSEVIGGHFTLDWLILREEIPFFAAADTSADAVRRMADALIQLGERLQYPLKPDLNYLRDGLRGCLEPPPLKPTGALGDPAQHRLTMGFVSRICREGRVPWVQGLFLGNLLRDYLSWSRREKVPWLRLKKKDIEALIVYRSRKFLSFKGVTMLAIIQGMEWFAEYLAAASVIPGLEGERITMECRGLFETGRKAVEAIDPAYRIHPTFESLIARPGPRPQELLAE